MKKIKSNTTLPQNLAFFSIRSETSSYLFAATSEDERTKWMEVIQSILVTIYYVYKLSWLNNFIII